MTRTVAARAPATPGRPARRGPADQPAGTGRTAPAAPDPAAPSPARAAGPGQTTSRKGARPAAERASAADRLSIRIDLGSGARVGPGKVLVLEEIARSGSISAAGRALRISYRRTWELVEDLNRTLGRSVVDTSAGGRSGGGARLTAFGRAVVAAYRAIEVDCAAAAHPHLLALEAARAAVDED